MPPPIYVNTDLEAILLEVRKAIREYFGRDPGEADAIFVRTRRDILGYVEPGSRIIRINVETYRKYIEAEGPEASTEYLFVIILHEYLHIMGIYDEREVRRISMEIAERVFGKHSRAMKIAESLADPRDIFIKRIGRPLSPYI
jgi:hypothetical protein